MSLKSLKVIHPGMPGRTAATLQLPGKEIGEMDAWKRGEQSALQYEKLKSK